MSNVLVHIIQISVYVCLFTLVKCEVFTAVTDIKILFHTHENVLSNLEQYIEVEENRLKVLER